jgi:hypothetical protein
VNPNDKRTNNEPRTPDGLRIGGHTRPVGSTQWGSCESIPKTNATSRDAPAVSIGSHAPAPAKPLKPGASEGNPCGFKPGVKGSR